MKFSISQAPHEGPHHPVGPRQRPRRHRHPGGGREDSLEGGAEDAARHRTGRLHRKGLAVEARVSLVQNLPWADLIFDGINLPCDSWVVNPAKLARRLNYPWLMSLLFVTGRVTRFTASDVPFGVSVYNLFSQRMGGTAPAEGNLQIATESGVHRKR